MIASPERNDEEADRIRWLLVSFWGRAQITCKSGQPIRDVTAHILLRMFKYLCAARAERTTRKSLNYACLSEAIKDGGFFMAWIVRLSVLPTWVMRFAIP